MMNVLLVSLAAVGLACILVGPSTAREDRDEAALQLELSRRGRNDARQ